ncbi:MAG: hypothetical protein Q8N03_01605 [Ignavibacteria bacterium]|nr:hypothetical protein [Ignavibacteria bacterium]
MQNDEIVFKYTFNISESKVKEFRVKVDKDTLNIVRDESENYPDWTLLDSFKCPHCPLDSSIVKYCPVAINLVDVIQEFKELNSFDECEVIVETPVRNYSKFTSLQSGVSSFLGMMMVTSGCPIMGMLKPMFNFHLPFATLEETEVRILSFYLLAQYVKWKRGGSPDWEMQNLSKIYDDIRILNHNVSRQIADLESKDTSINSLIVLNNFADYVTFTLDEKMLDELEIIFKELM